MTLTRSVKTCLFEYANFEGRASRSEFWWFALAVAAALVIAHELDQYLPIGSLATWVVILVTAIPLFAVGCRRLHDTDRSGWWQLLMLFPVFGAIMIVLSYAMPTTPMFNEHGPPPER